MALFTRKEPVVVRVRGVGRRNGAEEPGCWDQGQEMGREGVGVARLNWRGFKERSSGGPLEGAGRRAH